MVAEFEPVHRAGTTGAAGDVERSLRPIANGRRLLVRLTRWMQRVVTPASKA